MPNLASEKLCTGCTACASICQKKCIEMKTNQDGFAFPQITKSAFCMECGRCVQVCPILSRSKANSTLPSAYAAFSKDILLRDESSSGGVFTEISRFIIEKMGVVYGAAYNEKFGVYHCCVDNMIDLAKLRGAKYSESYLGNTLLDILKRVKQNQYVLFTGTPCQVAGLKAFLKKKYDNLICIDFVCHGIPSPMVWKEYLKYRSKRDAQGELPIAINLRSKASGWSKYQYSNLFQYENNNVYCDVSSRSLFMNLFVGDYISRCSCENCSFKGYNRISDITLGDFWGIWNIAPEMDDNKGTSVVLVHSDKGKNMWNDIKHRLVFKQVTLEQASQENPSMLVSSKSKKDRDKVLKMIQNGGIEECYKLFESKRTFCMNDLKNWVKRGIDKVF